MLTKFGKITARNTIVFKGGTLAEKSAEKQKVQLTPSTIWENNAKMFQTGYLHLFRPG